MEALTEETTNDGRDEVYNDLLALITLKELEADEVHSRAVKRCADMRTYVGQNAACLPDTLSSEVLLTL